MSVKQLDKARRFLDAPLLFFAGIMICAASITAHGTFVFYSYFLDGALPYAATAVLTAGIPLLEFAAVVDKPNRRRYVAGMVWFLFMEALAQYWQGQAVFTRRVLASFAGLDGADLVAAAQHPAGRLLPIVYLVALSGVVVYFGYAASARARELMTKPVKVTVKPAEPSVKPAVNPIVKLPDVVTLRDVDGLTFDEIGRRLGGISKQAAKQRYDKAKAQLAA